MNPKTQQALSAINRDFYEAVAEDFSATRRDPWPGWERVLSSVEALEPPSPLEVLDLGCGNGRFASFLRDRWHGDFVYLGVDSSPSLLTIAQETLGGVQWIRFAHHDVLTCDPLPLSGPARAPGSFDLIVLFGLLHHVPGFETRRALLTRAVERLDARGLLVVTAWRFGASERFERHILDWKTFNRERSDPIDPAQLEPGDHLLGWASSPLPRYCHFTDRDEMRALLDDLPVRQIDEFDSDGKSGDLNHYCVLQRTGARPTPVPAGTQ